MTLATIGVKPLDALIYVFAFFAVLLFALWLLGIVLAGREKVRRHKPKRPLADFWRMLRETKESDPHIREEFEIQPEVLAEQARRYTMGDLVRTPALYRLYEVYTQASGRPRKRSE